MYKGMAIMGVIITHLVLIQIGTNSTDNQQLPIVQFMYSGLIMFIVVSGYLYKSNRSYTENVRKRVIPLLVVFLLSIPVMTAVMYAYLSVLGYDLSSYSFVDLILKTYVGKGTFMDINGEQFALDRVIMAPYEVTIQMYYIQVLIASFLVFYAIADFLLKDPRVTVAAIAVLLLVESLYMEFIHIQAPFYLHLVPLFLAFLLLGAMMSRYRFADMLEKGIGNRTFQIGLVISLLLTLFFLLVFPYNCDITKSYFGNYGIFSVFIFCLSSLSSGIFQLFVASALSVVPVVSHVFLYMGKNILYFFLLHMLVAKMMIAPFITLDTEKWIPLDPLPAVCVAFAAMAVIGILSYIYRKMRYPEQSKS